LKKEAELKAEEEAKKKREVLSQPTQPTDKKLSSVVTLLLKSKEDKKAE